MAPDDAHARYQFVETCGGNHAYRIPGRADGTCRYMLAANWSEGEVSRTPQAFADYVAAKARSYNNPPRLEGARAERKP